MLEFNTYTNRKRLQRIKTDIDNNTMIMTNNEPCTPETQYRSLFFIWTRQYSVYMHFIATHGNSSLRSMLYSMSSNHDRV